MGIHWKMREEAISSRLLRALFLATFCAGLIVPSVAQKAGPATATGAESNTGNEKTDKDKDEDKQNDQQKPPPGGSFVIAPLPVSSPAIGTGIIPVVGYIFPLNKNDEESSPSTIGAAGLFTDNGTRAFALGGELYFGRNKYNATAAYVHGNINYNLYSPGILIGPQAKLPLEQAGQAFLGEFLRRIWWDFFLGPRFFAGSAVGGYLLHSGGSHILWPFLGPESAGSEDRIRDL